MINCIVLEDEKNAQKVLEHYIDQTKFTHCLGFFESGLDIPISLIKKADVLFLDIELPELNGLDFLKTIENPPKVIVTTAYPNFAVDAFELAVLDYLVKPFSYERFIKGINRVREQLTETNDESIFVYADKTMHKLKVEEILYIKSELDYVSIVTEKEQLLFLDSLNNWEKKMKPYDFIRIHRSYIVNSKRIHKVSASKVTVNTIEIPVGITYKAKLAEKFPMKLKD
jgi:DNA-binding LytR/AlgR family response regulator